MKRTVLLALALGLVISTSAFATNVYFDFGDSTQTTPGNYNNIIVNDIDTVTAGYQAVLSVANAIDSSGNGTGIGLAISGFYPGSNTTGTTTVSSSAAIFNTQATRDNTFGHTGPFGGNADASLGIVSITGLNPALTYNFTFFGSRMSVTDNRETEYSISALNSATLYLNTSNNTTNVAVATGIIPTASGTASVYVAAGPNNNNASKFFYLGALEMSYTPSVPEPASILLLTVSLVGLGVRRSSRLS